jgi:hypothetical protein
MPAIRCMMESCPSVIIGSNDLCAVVEQQLDDCLMPAISISSMSSKRRRIERYILTLSFIFRKQFRAHNLLRATDRCT